MAKKTNTKTKQSKESFRPGTESRDVFTCVLEITSELIDKKDVEIKVDSNGDLEFVICLSNIKDHVIAGIEGKLSFDDFMAVLSNEIESLMVASVYSDKAKGVKDKVPASIIKEMGVDEFVWRLNEFEKVIGVPVNLKKDSIFRKTTKGFAFEEVKWDTNCKVFDEELGDLDDLRFATLSILYSRPVTESYSLSLVGEGYKVQLPTITEPKQFKLELQKKDVSKLIDNLQLILEKL